ncbi:hypothetical protein BKD02_12415 [Brucella sp. 09RB8910]|nr:hypothetical protein BKD02_12415 [Brucella sp. 09RB8910]
MGNMAVSLERDPQMESILEIRKKQLGISMDLDSGLRPGQQLALKSRSRQGPGHRTVEPSFLPPFVRRNTMTAKYRLHGGKSSF